MNKKGFTLIELILVVAILGILAVSALPKFLDLSTRARQASRDGVVGAVRSGIALFRANNMVTSGGSGSYPSGTNALDTNADAGACTVCFNNILANGVNDASWTKTDDVTYVYNDGANTSTFAYNATNGTFQ